MKCLLVSGLWPTQDENGLNDLAEQISLQNKKIQCLVKHYDLSDLESYLKDADLAIGHSLGGNAIAVFLSQNPASNLKYAALIDPVDPKWDYGAHFEIKGSIPRVDCFIRDWWIFNFIPPSSRILNPIPNRFINYDKIKCGHASMPKHPNVRGPILQMTSQFI